MEILAECLNYVLLPCNVGVSYWMKRFAVICSLIIELFLCKKNVRLVFHLLKSSISLFVMTAV